MALNYAVFKRTLDGSAPVTQYFRVCAATKVFKGQLLMLSGGSVSAGVDGCTHIIGVCEETVDNLSGAVGDKSAPVNVNLQSVYEGLLDANSSNDYCGTRCELDSGTVIDPSDTTDPVVMCLGPIGTNTDKRQEFVILDYSGTA